MTNKKANKLEDVLNKLRPLLQADGGDVELVAWDEKTGVVQVKMLGMCSGCPMAQITLQEGIAKEIKKEIKQVKEVIAV
jgi:Fe-S cluster biogenesis protein NfuA